MFKESLRKILEEMIYAHRRESKSWDQKSILGCPFDQCCKICRKLFPEWSDQIDVYGLDPLQYHPCDHFTPEFVKQKIKEVILR